MATGPSDNSMAGPAGSPPDDTRADSTGAGTSSLPEDTRSFGAAEGGDAVSGSAIPQEEPEEEPRAFEPHLPQEEAADDVSAAAQEPMSYAEKLHANNLGREAALAMNAERASPSARTGGAEDAAGEDDDAAAHAEEEEEEDEDARAEAQEEEEAQEQRAKDIQTVAAFASMNWFKGLKGLKDRGFLKTAAQIGALTCVVGCSGFGLMVAWVVLVGILIFKGFSSLL
jgi:hypothetical protein